MPSHVLFHSLPTVLQVFLTIYVFEVLLQHLAGGLDVD